MARVNEQKQHAGSGVEAHDGLQMPPDVMLELANKTAELIVERIKNLPEEQAWDGEFKKELEDQLMEDPPEHGSPRAGGLGKGGKGNPPPWRPPRSSPILRVHPFGADLARGIGRLHGLRIPDQSMHLADFQRGQPDGTGRHRLDATLAGVSGYRRRPDDFRRFLGQPGSPGRRAGVLRAHPNAARSI